jgi:hypothetical protein
MLGEIPALRCGYDLNFGEAMNEFIGFGKIEINHPTVFKHDMPLFWATHNMEPTVKIYLRRNFSDVLKSCWKAEDDNPTSANMWFCGTEDEIYERWSTLTTYGTKHAEIVVDYDMLKQEPKAVVSAIFKHLKADVTNRELDLAVAAGSRENMLKEQNKLSKRSWDIINESNY